VNEEWPRTKNWRVGRAVLIALAAVLLAVATACGGGTRGPSGSGGDKQSNRPVDMVVPFGAGGGADQVARIAATSMEEELGTQLPVINTPGATGSTGITSMLTNPPGESVAILIQDTLATVPYGSASFELDQIQGVCRLQEMPSALFVQGDGPYQDWEALAAAAKERPGELRVATVGQGGVDDVMLAALAEQAGIEFRAVPFSEPSERYAALLGGAVDALYEQPGDVLSNLESGEFEPVMVFADERVEGLEGDYVLDRDVGVDLVLNQFRGIVTNAEADSETVGRLSDACAAVQEDPDFTEFQEQNFSTPESYQDAEEFTEYIQTQADTIAELQREFGLTGQ
jgi:tripartite-type tricarboxylate transporter receptor subunit TctC